MGPARAGWSARSHDRRLRKAPLSSFNSRSWPACYTEFWFGDGAPDLERQQPMLFEQVARRLVNLEELEYVLESGEEPCAAACQSRFSLPEIAAALGRTTHSTVHTADRRIRRQLESDESVPGSAEQSVRLRDLVDEVRQALRRA